MDVGLLILLWDAIVKGVRSLLRYWSAANVPLCQTVALLQRLLKIVDGVNFFGRLVIVLYVASLSRPAFRQEVFEVRHSWFCLHFRIASGVWKFDEVRQQSLTARLLCDAIESILDELFVRYFAHELDSVGAAQDSDERIAFREHLFNQRVAVFDFPASGFKPWEQRKDVALANNISGSKLPLCRKMLLDNCLNRSERGQYFRIFSRLGHHVSHETKRNNNPADKSLSHLNLSAHAAQPES